ncbi:hypothetical protein BDR26DRAFT_801541, partial [Obelidium mucronatum]
IQDREFQNMFIFAPGFEAATLKFPANFDADDGIPAYKKQIIGFAKFRSRKEANYARDYLTGRKVDLERGSVLKAEIAKKNLHIKQRSNTISSTSGSATGNSNDMTPTGYGNGSVTPAGIASAGFRCPADQNPPCNTLYVGNLATNTNETELRELFQRCPGYKRMSFRSRPNGPMVFVEFDSIMYAQQALGDMHGTLLSTSVKGGIRLSFSKNPLGVRPSGLTTPIGNGMMPPPSPSLMTPMSSASSSAFFDNGY